LSLSADIKEYALSLGYDRIGFTTADRFPILEKELSERSHMYDWAVSQLLRAADPKNILPEARSIVVFVYDYFRHAYPGEMLGKVGRYYQSWGGSPPHPVHRARNIWLIEFLGKQGCRVGWGLPCRPSSARAGVTGYGKNCFAFAKGIGSFISIVSLVIDKELEYDTPTLDVNCPEECTLCIDSCPTGALYEPLRMNPHLCIAYNTYATPGSDSIQGPEILPLELREGMGTWIFGCDVCQQVCPRNQAKLKVELLPNAFLEYIADDFHLEKILNMTDEQYNRAYNLLTMNYINDKRYFRRNAAVALGNQGSEESVPVLTQAMRDPDELIRGHAAWALGRIGGSRAKQSLESGLARETNEYVIGEIRAALAVS
jgi:epoxyqueuosine reductase